MKTKLKEKFTPDNETEYSLAAGLAMALNSGRPELIQLQMVNESDPQKKEMMRLIRDLLKDIDYLKQDVEMYREGYHDVLHTMHVCLRKHTE